MSNKVLITGSSKGIGKDTAKIFLNNKWDVCITSRSLSDLQILKKEFSVSKERLLEIKVDFRESIEILNLRKRLENSWGKIDSLIVNVGSGSGEKFITSNFKNNQDIFKENFYSAYYSSILLKDLLFESKNPSIFFVGSIAAVKNVNSPLSYAMSKKSIENFSKFLSVELSKHRVRVNCLQLGHVLTEQSVWKKKLKNDKENFDRFINANTLTKSLISPEEVASFIYNLHETKTLQNLTGSTIVFDAGISQI
jgi:3-oxoacyl-[acyl-carrier protein] reductase